MTLAIDFGDVEQAAMRLPGESPGADREVARAIKRGITVFVPDDDDAAVKLAEHEAADRIIRQCGEECGRVAQLHDAGGDVGARTAQRRGEARGARRGLADLRLLVAGVQMRPR